ncbi:MAG: HAD-IA family hydrolase [Armatimonadetes bacterium]|nr:HAD-IA family hydrolase [Armatimonadota bacterium]MDW8120933.1 HAD-IA family hydrolase [Armatimonadota bacterium]
MGFDRTIVRQDALEQLSQVDSLILDIDGVLIDVSESFPQAVQEAVHLYVQTELGWQIDAPAVTKTELDHFKRAGGFNNDWELAEAVVLFLLFKSLRHGVRRMSRIRRLPPTLEEFLSQVSAEGGGVGSAEKVALSQLEFRQRRDLARLWKRRLIIRLAQELYAGPQFCSYLYGFDPELTTKTEGYLEREKILVDPSLLKNRWRLGIVTGRTRKETGLVLARTNLIHTIPETFWMTDDDHPRKPHPLALKIVAEKLTVQVGVYVGDTVDDLKMVKDYQSQRHPADPVIFSCQVLTGHGGEKNRTLFLERGADIVCPSLNDLLLLLHQWSSKGSEKRGSF